MKVFKLLTIFNGSISATNSTSEERGWAPRGCPAEQIILRERTTDITKAKRRVPLLQIFLNKKKKLSRPKN